MTPYRLRFLVFAVLLTIPFVRMLLQHHYGFFYLEIAVALLIIMGLAAAAARATQTAAVFHALVIGLIVLLSANTVQVNFLPALEARWIIAGLLVLTISGAWLLRTNFSWILIVFVLGSVVGDIVNAANLQHETYAEVPPASGEEYHHVIHIILDEMIGLAGMPSGCAECIKASTLFQRSLERGNFRIYPYAFSNYRSTRDSIPSILNGHILGSTGEYLQDTEYVPQPFLRQNRYFDSYLKRDYAIQSYQSDFIRFDAPQYSSVHAHTYSANSLNALHQMDLSWPTRLQQLFVMFIQSDRLWDAIWNRFVPANFQPARIMVGPLAVEAVWPNQVLKDVRSAKQNTLFFLHLLTPHHPYLYAPDGTIRTLSELKSEGDIEVDHVAQYERFYRLYGEQIQFLTAQIDQFLEALRSTGLYDSTTIIIHGDHGSRIRLLSSSQRNEYARLRGTGSAAPPQSRFDYVEEPRLRDLLDRFSTLLAVKLPASRSPVVVPEMGSVLYFLENLFGPWGERKTEDDLNAVYLFNADGSPHRIEFIEAWQRAVAQHSENFIYQQNRGD
jgi:hypothetical protein